MSTISMPSQAIPKDDARPFVEYAFVKGHFAWGYFWFMLAIIGGFLYAGQFLQAYLLPGIEWLSPGRIRMVHTQGVAYGFIANCFLGALYWAVPRLTGQRVTHKYLGYFILYAWNALTLISVVGILFGEAQALEWGENPVWIDPIVLVGLACAAAQFTPALWKTKGKLHYVSVWYFSGALAWTGLVYFMGNFGPEYWAVGTGGAALTGLYIHDLVGLFVTPIGWGLMYYFVPILINKPIWSHKLSLLGFWGLAFFYPLQGIHHFLYSPIPMYAQYGAVVTTIAIEIVVTTVVINFFATLRKREAFMVNSLPVRWFYTGMILYFITCLQCSFQVTLTFQKIIHFTDWVVGHAHLVMFGVFGFWIMGMIEYLWPKVTKAGEWYSNHLSHWSYWLMGIGLIIMFSTLTIAGLVQGYLWRDLAVFEASISASVPFWWARYFSGLMIVVGAFITAFNMYKTAEMGRAK